MASNQTTNYQLNQWESTDQVLRTDFNADNAKLDAVLAGLAEDVSGKAGQTALDALSSTVAGHTAAMSGFESFMGRTRAADKGAHPTPVV